MFFSPFSFFRMLSLCVLCVKWKYSRENESKRIHFKWFRIVQWRYDWTILRDGATCTECAWSNQWFFFFHIPNVNERERKWREWVSVRSQRSAWLMLCLHHAIAMAKIWNATVEFRVDTGTSRRNRPRDLRKGARELHLVMSSC